MHRFLKSWCIRHLGDSQIFVLFVLLSLGFVVVLGLGQWLAPLLAGLIIAYLLEGVVQALQRLHIPRKWSVYAVFLGFILSLIVLFLIILPILGRQLQQAVYELPRMVLLAQSFLLQIPEHYPQWVTEAQIRYVMDGLRALTMSLGQHVLSLAFASLRQIAHIGVYMIIVPLTVFFLLKDKEQILAWLQGFLPAEIGLTQQVWLEVNQRMAAYIRGKLLEIVIVWGVCYLTFLWFGLKYPLLLSLLVGVSVIIPLVGAIVVTLPVAAVALFQWGWSQDTLYLLLAYTVIQQLDGNVLVPVLFSEVVQLHPIAIISAVIVFGQLWGIWGVFFAIPLATLINAVIHTRSVSPVATD